MSAPISGSGLAGAALGANIYGLLTGIDCGVVFGAFAGAVFYIATAATKSRLNQNCKPRKCEVFSFKARTVLPWMSMLNKRPIRM